jgi:hypothetical protein
MACVPRPVAIIISGCRGIFEYHCTLPDQWQLTRRAVASLRLGHEISRVT